MCRVEIRQRAASEGQRSTRRGQEGQPTPLFRASWSTVSYLFLVSLFFSSGNKQEGHDGPKSLTCVPLL